MQSKNKDTFSSINEKIVTINNLERQVIALQFENEKLLKQNVKKDDEIEDIVSYYTKTGRLPLHYMQRKLELERLDEEERVA